MSQAREPLPTRVQDTPETSTAYADAVDAGTAAMDLALTSEARAAIDGHIRLLLAWTGAVNLTSIRDPVGVATSHVIDSLTAVATMRESGVDRFLDLGSGGGLPGIPLAAAIPDARVLLVEATHKKATFLQTAVDAVGMQDRVRVASERAETLAFDAAHRERWSCVTARAVAPLGELVELAFPLLRRGGALIAWKRGDLTDELAAGARAVHGCGGGELRVIEVDGRGLAGHRLVVATRTGPVRADLPREPATRRRRPW